MRLYALALAGLAAAAPALAQQDFHWSGTLTKGQRLEVKGVSGWIHVSAAPGATAEVNAVKHARHSDPASVQIKVVPFSGGVTICAVYPAGRDADEPNSCESGRNWHSNTGDNDVQVDFTVTVPAGVNFTGRDVNGGIEAEGLSGDADVSTVNGSVHVSTTGRAQATTVNGSIEASMGRADFDEAEFTTVNGGVTVTLPANVSTEVSARTVNGDIDTDFPLTVEGRFGPRSIHGTIGAGGRTLRLETVNGDISLRKR